MRLPYNSQISALLPAVDLRSCDDASMGSAVGETDSKADGNIPILFGYPAGESVEQGIARVALQSGASGQKLSSAVVGAGVRQTGIKFGYVRVLLRAGNIQRADQ